MYLEIMPGCRTALLDGTMVRPSPFHMASEKLYYARKGDRLSLAESGYLYAVALYSLEIDTKYVYTYAYQPESNWTTYLKNLTPESYIGKEYIFNDECFFRVNVKRVDDKEITREDTERRNVIIFFESSIKKYFPKKCFEQETEKTVQAVKKAMTENSAIKIKDQHEFVPNMDGITNRFEGGILLALLADTHYTVNGTWEDTSCNLKAVVKELPLDAIVHLGDLTDGLLSREGTSRFVKHMINDLLENDVPIFITIGNHDTNYFNNNAERFTIEEQIELYGMGRMQEGRPYYYVDLKDKIRLIFLYAFDYNRPVKYGFDEAQLFWVKKTLNSTPEGYQIVLFSHDAPIAELDFWSFYIWNGDKLLEVLEEYNARKDRHILALFHGHTHGDYVYKGCSFPIVSIGCAKCESVSEIKPSYIKTPYRKLGDQSQDLWDIVIIRPDQQFIQIIRYGAGEDRILDCRKKNSKWLEMRRTGRSTEGVFPAIWAHRGVSGYAPENTMPAFELARRMQLDGVELDVQLSKDGEVVVIHDESIDRTSNGTGMVRDYTLQELRKYNYAAAFPQYGEVTIPTFEEVLDIFHGTSITINVELKNSVVFYEGLEEKVLQLVRKYGMEKQIWYSSFNHFSLMHLKKIEPEAKIGFLYSEQLLEMPEYAKRFKAQALHPDKAVLNLPEWMEKCHKEGIKIHLWTVNDEQAMRLAARMGVDAVITNYPDRCLKLELELEENEKSIDNNTCL